MVGNPSSRLRQKHESEPTKGPKPGAIPPSSRLLDHRVRDLERQPRIRTQLTPLRGDLLPPDRTQFPLVPPDQHRRTIEPQRPLAPRQPIQLRERLRHRLQPDQRRHRPPQLSAFALARQRDRRACEVHPLRQQRGPCQNSLVHISKCRIARSGMRQNSPRRWAQTSVSVLLTPLHWFMELDPAKIAQPDRYKILIGAIVPRPIAFVSTISQDGRPNLAPFSFFSGVGSNPMTLLFCPVNKADGSEKDSLRNAKPTAEGGTGEFVVNVATDAIARQVAACAEPLPYGKSEFDLSGLTTA